MNVLLMYSTHAPSAEHITRLESRHGGVRVSVADSEADARAQAQTADVIFGHRYLRQCLPQARRLRWVQSTAGGVDRLPLDALAKQGVMLTRMTVSAPVIARHAVTLAWAVTRRLPEAVARQREGQWDASFDWPPQPQRAAVFGMGAVGKAVAQCLHADGITVYGVRRRSQETMPAPFARVYDRTSWRDVLPHVDWCILALPHTAGTRGQFDREALSRLPAHAVLVNVGRGETVITSDLVQVLEQGHLSGAALDVISPSPTGPDDPVWHTPRLLLTPYVAAHSRERPAALERFCEAQLARYRAGTPLQNQVLLPSRTPNAEAP
ncbi:MAG: D-2-hydroxyacid dehydrogenase [Salinibacter sp.]